MFQKSIYTFLLLSLFTTGLFAQPVIQNTVLPNIGDVISLTTADTVNVSQGNAGANQTWNFSAWHEMDGTTATEYTYVSPAGTPYAANFPNATIVSKINEDTVIYAYFREQANQFAILGSGSLSFLQTYTDPDAQLKFPTNYNSSFQENFAYSTDAGTGIIFYSKGNRNTKYDAYGTLITPLGTFQNAMRFKAESSQVDSASFFGTELINHTNLTTYGWLVAGHPGTVASVYYTSLISETRIPGFDTLITEIPAFKSVNYVSASSVGVFDPAPQLSGITEMKLGPNPASENLQLSFISNQDRKNLKLEVLDLQGRLMHTQLLDAQDGPNLVSLPVASFASGTYFLTLSDGKGVQGLSWVKY